MPMNNFSLGRDVSLDIAASNGQIVSFNLVTSFDKKQMTNKIKIKGIDGVTRYLEVPDGWEGSIDVTRGDRRLDDYVDQLEADYYAGKNVQAQSITETISEPDGTISQWRYEGVMFRLDDGGKFEGDKEVKQKLSWCASRRRKVI